MELEPLTLAAIISIINKNEEEREKIRKAEEKKNKNGNNLTAEPPPALTELSEDTKNATYDKVTERLDEFNKWAEEVDFASMYEQARVQLQEQKYGLY